MAESLNYSYQDRLNWIIAQKFFHEHDGVAIGPIELEIRQKMMQEYAEILDKAGAIVSQMAEYESLDENTKFNLLVSTVEKLIAEKDENKKVR